MKIPKRITFIPANWAGMHLWRSHGRSDHSRSILSGKLLSRSGCHACTVVAGSWVAIGRTERIGWMDGISVVVGNPSDGFLLPVFQNMDELLFTLYQLLGLKSRLQNSKVSQLFVPLLLFHTLQNFIFKSLNALLNWGSKLLSLSVHTGTKPFRNLDIFDSKEWT